MHSRRIASIPLLLAVCPALLLSAAIPAQPAASPQAASAHEAEPKFDVAAIRLNEPLPHEHNSIWSSPFDGHFKAENISVLTLIDWAYEMPETRVLGAPAWIGTTHFNIDAAADPALDQHLHNLTADEGRHEKEQMVQALLADRFRLATHTETRELPIYALVVAKGGAKLGPVQANGSNVSTSNGRIEVQMSDSVAVLAEELAKVVGRDVFDRTGIAGRYDLKLKWTPYDGASPIANESAAPGADSGPSIFTALEEQLGLKLVPQEGPVQVLVIDHVEVPSAN
jgi:uncharacterized protein (TIGR03435 family)